MTSSGFFNYIPGNSILHKLDPRTKYHFTLILVELFILYDNPIYILASLVVCLFLWKVADLPFKDYKNLLTVLLYSILFLIVFNGFFVPGEISLFQAKIPYIGVLRYTLSGLVSSVGIGLRFITAFLMVPIVISTTKPLDIIASLRYLRLPYKVSFVVSIVFRFFPILENSMIEVQEAQKSRGLETDKGNLLEKIKKSIPIVFPMIFKCLYMVDQLAWSIESRGFGITTNPTVIKELKLSKLDKIIILLSWVVIVLIPLYMIFFNSLNIPEIFRPWMNISNKGIDFTKIL